MKEEKGLWAGSPRSGVQTCFFTICHMTVDEWPLYMVFTVYPQVVCVVQPLNYFPPGTCNGLPPPELSALTLPLHPLSGLQ